jgi:hypothetical protein
MTLSIVRVRLSNVEKEPKPASSRVTCELTEAGLHHRQFDSDADACTLIRLNQKPPDRGCDEKRVQPTIEGSNDVQERPREHPVSRGPPSTLKDRTLVGLRGDLDPGTAIGSHIREREDT